MLISVNSRSQDESRNWRVSIETLDFARVRTYTCLIGVGSPVRGGDHQPDPAPFPADDRTPSPPAYEQHSRQWRAENGWGRVRGSATREAQRPSDDVPGNHRLPPWTSLVDVVASRAGWVRETAGGAVAHLSISRRAARQRDAIADRMPGMGDHSAFFLCIQNRWVAVWGQT